MNCSHGSPFLRAGVVMKKYTAEGTNQGMTCKVINVLSLWPMTQTWKLGKVSIREITF